MVGRSAFRVSQRISKFANSNAGAKAQFETMRACNDYFARHICILTFPQPRLKLVCHICTLAYIRATLTLTTYYTISRVHVWGRNNCRGKRSFKGVMNGVTREHCRFSAEKEARCARTRHFRPSCRHLIKATRSVEMYFCSYCQFPLLECHSVNFSFEKSPYV